MWYDDALIYSISSVLECLSEKKKLKFFSIRVKELSEPIVLRKKATGFCSFQEHFLEKPIFE